MPNRILKESIRTSKSVNELTDFEYRVWSYLIVSVDDYGRYHTDPELLKGLVFPRRKGLTENQIGKALASLANIGMIKLYTVDGESYLCFPNWDKHQQIRAKASKFPAPDDSVAASDIICNQTQADVPVIQSYSRIENPESKSEKRARASADAPSPFVDSPVLQDAFDRWLRYKQEKRDPYKPQGLNSLITQIQRNAEKYGVEAVSGLIDYCMASNWKGIIWERLEKQQRSDIPAAPYEYNPGDTSGSL